MNYAYETDQEYYERMLQENYEFLVDNIILSTSQNYIGNINKKFDAGKSISDIEMSYDEADNIRKQYLAELMKDDFADNPIMNEDNLHDVNVQSLTIVVTELTEKQQEIEGKYKKVLRGYVILKTDTQTIYHTLEIVKLKASNAFKYQRLPNYKYDEPGYNHPYYRQANDMIDQIRNATNSTVFVSTLREKDFNSIDFGYLVIYQIEDTFVGDFSYKKFNHSFEFPINTDENCIMKYSTSSKKKLMRV